MLQPVLKSKILFIDKQFGTMILANHRKLFSLRAFLSFFRIGIRVVSRHLLTGCLWRFYADIACHVKI